MLEGRQALDLALELARMPTLAEPMRIHPLPPDTLVVIRIAAGCAETQEMAVAATGHAPATIREACVYYLQQVLFAPNADSHRVLGVMPGAPRRQMREHMRWLMTWLHPDTNGDDWESVFAERVLTAWREAGTTPRRGDADADRAPRRRRAAPRAARPAQRWVALPLQKPSRLSVVRRLLLAAAAIVGVVGLAVMLVPALISL